MPHLSLHNVLHVSPFTEFRAGFNNVTRWFLTLVNQPEVKRVIGDVALCSKAATFDAKAFAEFNAGNKGQKKQRTISGKQDAPAVEV